MSASPHQVGDAVIGLPEGMQVFERGWLSANNILFTQGDARVLIDSGYCTHSDQTLALVADALKGRTLDVLINTHLHSDHCGGNAALQAAYPQMRTLIPPGHADEVARWDANALTYTPTGQQCPRFTHDGVLLPGAVMTWGATHWEVHAAGGHDPHSVVLFEPAHRLLISADALWENGFGVIFPELEGIGAFDEAAQTLQMIEALDPLTVIPGHGRVFRYTSDVMQRARQRLQYFQANPAKHSVHAVKVLMKFKLLEMQRQPIDQFLDWAENTAYFQWIWRRLEVSLPMRAWLSSMLNELITAGAAQRAGSEILNS